MAENAQGYVTRSELLETKIELRDAFEKDTDEIKRDIKTINEIVLPMGKWLEGIEGNTKHMAQTLDETNKTNKEIVQQLNRHETEISQLKGATTQKTERIKARGAIIVGFISLLGATIGALAAYGEKLAQLIYGG
jgi:methyl-accepting chemotaxis protein